MTNSIQETLTELGSRGVPISDFNREFLDILQEVFGDQFRVEALQKQIALILSGVHVGTLRRPGAKRLALLLPRWTPTRTSFTEAMAKELRQNSSRWWIYCGRDGALAIEMLKRHYADAVAGVSRSSARPHPVEIKDATTGLDGLPLETSFVEATNEAKGDVDTP